ncbi:MAG: site-2 protease family protein [Chloroflexota bacterium]
MDIQLVFGLLAAVIIVLVGFPVHEFSHALAAYRLGDSTARYQGRLTLNPIAHFDPLGGLMLLISSIVSFPIGWAKPTPVNPYNLRYGRRGEALVAAAGPISNLFMAALVAIPIRIIWSDLGMRNAVFGSVPAAAIYDVAWFFVLINSFLFLFNLLPIPPLDGWKVLTGFLDARTAYNLRQFEQYGFVVLLVLILFGGRYIAPIGDFVFNLLVGGALLMPL